MENNDTKNGLMIMGHESEDDYTKTASERLRQYKLTSGLKRVVVYGKAKIEYKPLKKVIYGTMGGFFVGLAFLAYVLILSIAGEGEEFIARIIGSLFFPVGIIAIILLGGNLFTSNTLVSLSARLKVVRRRDFAQDLLIVFLSNLLGGIISGLVMALVGLYSEDFTYQLLTTATKKLESSDYSIFYNTFFSGIMCNILVAGAIFSYTILSNENKGVALFAVYFLIAVFALFGFQHIVANMAIFAASAFASLFNDIPLGVELNELGEQVAYVNKIDYHEVTSASDFFFRVFLINFPLATLGNLVGGILISEVYFYAESQRLKKIKGIDIFKETSHLRYDAKLRKKNIKNNKSTTNKK